MIPPNNMLVALDKNDMLVSVIARVCGRWDVVFREDYDMLETYSHLTDAARRFILYNMSSRRTVTAVYYYFIKCPKKHRIITVSPPLRYHCSGVCDSITNRLRRFEKIDMVDIYIGTTELFKLSRSELWCTQCANKDFMNLFDLWTILEPVLNPALGSKV